MSEELPAIEIARRKVLAWMHEQESRGIYPWAWNCPDFDEYLTELRKPENYSPALTKANSL